MAARKSEPKLRDELRRGAQLRAGSEQANGDGEAKSVTPHLFNVMLKS